MQRINGIKWLVRLFNSTKDNRMPDVWRKSYFVVIYQNKGDVQEYRNYYGIKLMKI